MKTNKARRETGSRAGGGARGPSVLEGHEVTFFVLYLANFLMRVMYCIT